MNGVGLFVADQDPNASGDQSLVIPDMIPGATGTYSRDSWAGIVSRANVVVGDGYADQSKTGFDRDLVNIDGAMRLAEGSLPSRAECVPDAEMLGMVAFSGGRLWLAMPKDIEGGDTTPIWRAIALEEDHLEPDPSTGQLRAVKSDRPELSRQPGDDRRRPKTDQRAAPAPDEELSTAERYARANRPATDAFQRQAVPRMQVITEPGNVVRMARAQPGESPLPQTITVLFNQVDPTHFTGGDFTIAWRRLSPLQRGGRRTGEMSWQTIDPDNYDVNFASLGGTSRGDRGGQPTGRRPPVPEIVIHGVDFAAANATGETGEGATIQLMAVTAHGNIASTSFRLSE